ncbi:MAG: hypothetical protein U5K30_00285 [Acidimicrobiales bacterium]|nr:hypothetical protein [Acidimicrobiales bacterium]
MPTRHALIRTEEILAGIIAATVLLLAVLAGRSLFLGDLIIETHGYIGNAVFMIALANVGVTLAARADGVTAAVAFAVALLTFSQIGLGYVGRDTPDAAALHVPNGVLLMGLAGYQFAAARTRRLATRRSAEAEL